MCSKIDKKQQTIESDATGSIDANIADLRKSSCEATLKAKARVDSTTAVMTFLSPTR